MLLAIGGAVGWHPPARLISTPMRCTKAVLATSSSVAESSEGDTAEETSMVVMEDGIQIKMSSTPMRPEIGKKERNNRLRELNGAIANCFIKVSCSLSTTFESLLIVKQPCESFIFFLHL